jgi:putative alpha-1,2-mannosidase
MTFHISMLFASSLRYPARSDDDYAAYKLGVALGKPVNVTSWLFDWALRAPFTLYNDRTGVMEARNADGSWAGKDRGWTEGLFAMPSVSFFISSG